MTIYEVQCRFCKTVQLIDSHKHLYKRADNYGDGGLFVQCQSCEKLFRVISSDLQKPDAKEILKGE